MKHFVVRKTSAVSSEKGPYHMFRQHIQSDQGLCCLITESLDTVGSVEKQSGP